MPTAAERAGDFSGPVDPGLHARRADRSAHRRSLPRQPHSGEPAEPRRASRYLKLYPLPNTTPTAGSCNNWVTSLNTPIN